MVRYFLTWPLAVALLAQPGPTAGAELLKLEGTLSVLPRTERCDADGKLKRATALYRVERVLRGAYSDSTVLVVHRCPEIPRGPSKYGRGDAGALGPAQIHILSLEPIDDLAAVKGLVDPFTDDKRPRYKAYRTDRGSHPPRIVVSITGGAGTSYRLRFDARGVVIGRASDADVMLSHRDVARRHLRLRVVDDVIEVVDLGSPTGTTINGKRLAKPRKITYRDRIRLGPYELRVSLLLRVE